MAIIPVTVHINIKPQKEYVVKSIISLKSILIISFVSTLKSASIDTSTPSKFDENPVYSSSISSVNTFKNLLELFIVLSKYISKLFTCS